MKKVVVIDYDMGNIDSVVRAVQKCGGTPYLSNNKADIQSATHLILPGVGAFKGGMEKLNSLGLRDMLGDQVVKRNIPLLGICLGMHLLAEKGFEDGETKGLGFIQGDVKRLQITQSGERIPHVGWNEIHVTVNNPLFSGIKSGSDCFFVHSYHLNCSNQTDVIATTPYCGEFVSAVNRKNIYGVQFHPEKSQTVGLALLKNFLTI